MTNDPTPTPKPRRRGAQPGNQNALKHGFYSRKFRAVDSSDLAVMSTAGDEEIDALRVAARHIFEIALEVSQTSPMDAVKAFCAFGNQVRNIYQLLRTRSAAGGKAEDEIARAAIDAILEVAKEWQ